LPTVIYRLPMRPEVLRRRLRIVSWFSVNWSFELGRLAG